MPNENEFQSAETTVTTDDTNHADGIENNENDVNDTVFNDDDTTNEGGADNKQTQSKEQNSQNARRRREAERNAEIQRVQQEARNKAIIDALDGVNPYTNEEMKDSLDVEEYLAMKEIAKSGGDPIGDYAKSQKQKQRQQAESQKQKEQSKEWYTNNRNEFIKKYPDVDINKLVDDENFIAYVGGRGSTETLVKLYEGYTELSNRIRKQLQDKEKQQLANSKATPGALSTTGTNNADFFTKEQVQKMTPAEIKKNFEKIRQSQAKW